MEVEHNLTVKEASMFHFYCGKKSNHQSRVVISVGSRMITECMDDSDANQIMHDSCESCAGLQTRNGYFNLFWTFRISIANEFTSI